MSLQFTDFALYAVLCFLMPMTERTDICAWNRAYGHMNWANAHDICWIYSRLSSDSCILDIGAGTCLYEHALLSFSEKRLTFFALDLSQIALMRGLKNQSIPFKNKNGTIHFFVGTSVYLPFKSQSFDVVLCIHVLQHMNQNDRKKSVEEIYRVLKPNGLVFFESFGKNDMRYGGTPYCTDDSV